MWHWTLTSWCGNGARHIVPSLVVYVHGLCVYQEPWSGHSKNFKCPVWPWPLTRSFTQKWCATNRHLMGCVCITYEVNQSNREGAKERTGPKLRTNRVTLTFDLLTRDGVWHIFTSWVVCVPHVYEVIRSNREGASWERTRPKLQTTPVILTFDLLTQNRCTTHRHLMGCVCTAYEVNRSNRDGASDRTQQKLKTTPETFDLLTQKWCVTHRYLMGCVCTTYEVNRSNKDGATERTRSKLTNDPCDLDLWPFHPEMVRDTSSPHGLCVYHIGSDSVQ